MEIDADKLKAHASSQGLTQADLSERAGVSPATVSKIMSRRRALPSTMRRICDVLGTRIEDYLVPGRSDGSAGSAAHVLREDDPPYRVMRRCAYRILDELITDCQDDTMRIAALADRLQRMREEMGRRRTGK